MPCPERDFDARANYADALTKKPKGGGKIFSEFNLLPLTQGVFFQELYI